MCLRAGLNSSSWRLSGLTRVGGGIGRRTRRMGGLRFLALKTVPSLHYMDGGSFPTSREAVYTVTTSPPCPPLSWGEGEYYPRLAGEGG
jgi:hypothetical protein